MKEKTKNLYYVIGGIASAIGIYSFAKDSDSLIVPDWIENFPEIVNQAIPDDLGGLELPNNIIPDDIIPNNLVPDDLVPDDIIPNNLVPDNLLPDNEFVNNLFDDAQSLIPDTIGNIDIPDLGSVEVPDVPNIIPDIQVPDLGSVEVPDVPDIDLSPPSLPSPPDLNIPDIPDVDAPDISLPEFEPPEVSIPEPPQFNIPTFEPPSLDIPDPPSVTVPNVDVGGAIDDASDTVNDTISGIQDSLPTFGF